MSAVVVALVSALVAQAPAASPRPKAIVLDVKASAGAEELARAATNVLAVELQRLDRFEVITAADVRALVEQEASRQALGCDTTTASCMAEIAGALGAELAFYGEASKLGDLTVVTLNFFDAKANAARGRTSIEVRDAAALPAAVRAAIPELLGDAPSKTSADASFGAMGVAGSIVGVAGLALAGGGAGWAAWMASIEGDPKSLARDKQLAADTHTAAGIVAIAGAAAAVAGGALVVGDLVLE